MDEEKKDGMNTCNCRYGCCRNHGMMGGRHHYVAKRILGIIVLLVVFWFGTKLGELRTLMQYSRGSHMMMGGSTGYGSYGNRMMMVNPATTTTPTTPAAQ
jgi:hypothetical protein